MEESQVCDVCADFEPQAWRKSLCRNCFHSLEEHSDDMLAAEAEAVAKEKVEGKAGSKAEETKPSGDVKKTPSADDKDPKAKPKGASSPSSKSSHVPPPVASKSKTSQSSLSTSSSSSSSSSSIQASKSSLKSSSAGTSKATSSSSTSTTSSSSPSTSTTTSTSPSTPSTTGPRAGKPSQSIPAPSTSKAKSLTSKFENKGLESKDSKTIPKTTSTEGLKAKTTDSGDSAKEEHSDSKTASKVTPSSKLGNGSDHKKVGDEKSKKVDTSASKEKSESDTSGKGGKDVKIPTGRTKNVVPFGKDMLKSTKDILKKEKEKSTTEKTSNNNSSIKDKEHNLTSKSGSPKKDSLSKVEDKKKSFATEKSENIEKGKIGVSSSETKTGSGVSASSKSTEEKVGQLKTQHGDGTGKLPADPDNSRSTREIDKTGTSKINAVSGQEASAGAVVEKEAGKRQPSASTSNEHEKGDNRKQENEKTGKTSECDVKDAPVPKWQVSAKGKFQSGPSHAADQPSSKKGPSGVEEASRHEASHKDRETLTTKIEKPSDSVTSKVVSSPSSSDTTSTSKSSTATTSTSSSKSSQASPTSKGKSEKGEENDGEEQKLSTPSSLHGRGDDKTAKKLSEELKKKEETVAALENKLSKMEKRLKILEEEQDSGAKAKSTESKEEMEKMLKGLRSQLVDMEKQCAKLENDNQTLKENFQEQEESVKRDQESRGKTDENTILQQDLERTEVELDEVKDENSELKREIMEMKNEMDEMYDTFRENEHDEFRELQKELDMTAKNCRILQFKLRKAERRNEQIEEDRIHYEEKLRQLQDQFDSADAKNHIRILEEELRVAKEVSVRLHDELDIIEDKKNKAVEDNKHLTELLEHTDKRQFRMEMEIDKLRDMVSDLKQQLKEEKSKKANDGNSNNNNDGTTNNKDVSPDRKLTVGSLTPQSSRDNQDYDVSQLMKDLCDSMERENDLKDQLKFTEEEAKMMRRRVSEMDEENENLRLQLKKMSEKASKHKKQEQKRVRELEEERKVSEAAKAALTRQHLASSTEMVVVVGAEDSDVMTGDEPIPISERKDSTDEDLMNVMQLRVQMEMLEQELMTSHKKLDDMDLENENLHDEVKFLQERLEETEKSQDSNLKPPEPSSPNAYYEDKIKELTQDVDDLRWKLIEKDREIERLSVVQTRHSRDHGHSKRSDRLKKSKSLDMDNDPEVKDLRKQVEHLQMEVIRWKKHVEDTEERNEELTKQIADQSNKPVLPQVEADDAAVENIELRDQVKKMEAELKDRSDKIKLLTDDLQRLSRDTKTYQNIATSPMLPGSPGILNIPPSWSENLGARAKASAANQLEGSVPRDPATQLLALQEENLELRRQMAVLRLQEPRGVADGSSSQSAPPSRATAAAATFVEEIPPAEISAPSPPLPKPTEKESEGYEEGKGVLPCSAPGTSSSAQESINENNVKSCAGQAGIRKEDSVDSTSSSLLLGYFDSGSQEGDTQEDKTAKGLSVSSSTSSDMATVAKDSNSGGKPNIPDDGGGGKDRHGDMSSAEGVKTPRTRSEEEGKSSILAKYPDSKSKVVVTGDESRVELMEKILDMDDEIGELISCIRKREDEYTRMCRDVKVIKTQMQELKDDSRRNERDLLQELDMLHDKNTVMSNLLDIINERAEAAEEELERRIQEGTTVSPPRSASNVSQVSALSDTSMGSDEVFLNAHGNKEGVITRDWEAKLKTRIESLERLLAEERQKVVTAEKKLNLSATETISPSVSDDVKLRLREKELLQEELVESQRHLRIATDQIQGLRERLVIVEEEYHRLKMDYGKLYDEIDKPMDKEMERRGERKEDQENLESTSASDSDKTPENSIDAEHPFLAKKISVIEAPKLSELKALSKNTDAEVQDLKDELAKYKSKCEELEYKVEEINDIWRSKSAASDREKDDFEVQVRQKSQEVQFASETLDNLKQALCGRDRIVAEYEIKLKEKQQEIDRRNETIKEQGHEIKKHEQDQQIFLTQVSQRDGSIRGLNDTIRIRDERLKEKDDILFKLNSSIDEMKSRLKVLEQRNSELVKEVEEKEGMISRLRSQVTSSPPPTPEAIMCHTDAEKECARMKESNNKLKEALKKSETDKQQLEGIVEQSRQTMNESMVLWKNEKATLQRDMNVLEEKVRMYEVYNTQDQGEAIESLKVEAHEYFREKENLKLQLESVKVKAEADERTHQSQVSRFQSELTEKLRLLKNEVEKNTRLALENERLSVQAEKAYRYHQEERVLKAEHQAMRVRYETRFDKMYKEYNKMVATIETLQKEKERDHDIIQAMQKNMTLIKDKYTDELLKSDDDKATLNKQMKEIEELRGHLDGLMKIVRELQDKSTDQERLRAELINKMATDKASWEIERANLNSHVNQLEEQLSFASRQQNRAKDIQVNMGITWEKERKEQKRLLAEAHTLALDLQEQLRARDEAFAHERKELLRQMEGDRLTWTKEKRESEKRMTQFESNARKLTALQKRVIESQDALEKDSQQWKTDRRELLDQLNQSRQAHAKDCKWIEDVVAGLVQLRELGAILDPQGSSNPDLDKKFILHVKKAVGQINKAAEELSGPIIGQSKSSIDSLDVKYSTEKLQEKSKVKRDEGDIIIPIIHQQTETLQVTRKQQAPQGNPPPSLEDTSKKPSSDDLVVSKTTSKSSAPKPATSNSIAQAIEKLQTSGSAKNTGATASKSAPPASKTSAKVEKSATESKNSSSSSKGSRPKLELNTNTWPRKLKQEPEPKTAPVTMRPFDFYSRRYERPPSYTSGTRSAQSSRATTPDISDPMTNSLEFTPSKKSGLPDPPPCFILPHHSSGSVSPHRSSPSPVPATDATVTDRPKARRPATFGKSLSVDSSDILDSADSPHRLTSMPKSSNSASTTPTQEYATSETSDPTATSGSNFLSVNTSTSRSRNKKYSPRTARKKFFAETPPTTESQDILAWPERKSTTPIHRPAQLPDPIEVRREAEEEYVSASSKQEDADVPHSIKASVSWDEKIHFHAINEPSTDATPDNSGLLTRTSASTLTSSIPEDAELPSTTTPTIIVPPPSKSAKEKRKLFKKSGSLDSTVGSSIAKAGVSAMPIAAPTGFTKYDFFAAVKGKLKPVFRQKSANAKAKDTDGRSPSPLFIPTEVPDINFGSSGSTLLPVPVPQVNFRELEREEEEEALQGHTSARSRNFHREGQGQPGKWRSKSADRVATSSRMHKTQSMGSSQEVWKFNETDL